MRRNAHEEPYRLALPPTRRECDDRTAVLLDRLADIRTQLALEAQIGDGLRYQSQHAYDDWRRRATMALIETERDLGRLKKHRALLPLDQSSAAQGQHYPYHLIEGLLGIIDRYGRRDAPVDEPDLRILDAARRYIDLPRTVLALALLVGVLG